MKRLQSKLNKILGKMRDLRSDLFYQSLPEVQKRRYHEAMVLLNDIEDYIIINHIITKK